MVRTVIILSKHVRNDAQTTAEKNLSWAREFWFNEERAADSPMRRLCWWAETYPCMQWEQWKYSSKFDEIIIIAVICAGHCMNAPSTHDLCQGNIQCHLYYWEVRLGEPGLSPFSGSLQSLYSYHQLQYLSLWISKTPLKKNQPQILNWILTLK